MRSFTIRSSDIARCPLRSFSASHWRPDRTCECEHRAEHEARLAELDGLIAELDGLIAAREDAAAERKRLLEKMGRRK